MVHIVVVQIVRTLNINKKADINLICNNDNYTSVSPPKELAANVYSNDSYQCQFDIWYQTGVACPWNCLTISTGVGNINEYSVCSKRGTCLFDPYAKMTRCICDVGYEGSNCQTESPPNDNSSNFWILDNMYVIGIMIVLAGLLLVVSCLFWYYYIRLHKKYKNLEKKQGLLNSDFENVVGSGDNSMDAAKSVNSPSSSNKSDEEQAFIAK
eukprot:148698_1